MDYTIDIEKLNKLLKDFYTLTKINITVLDNSILPIASYPNRSTNYCELLRHNAQAHAQCALCNKEACLKAKKTNGIYIYRCHAGMVEAVTPIRCNDVQVGYIMFGQILQTEDYDRSWEALLPYLSELEVDIDQLKKAYYEKPSLTREIIHSSASIMNACAGYLYLSEMISVNLENDEKRINTYLENHISEPISAETLCSKLSLSRDRLYEISKHIYGCGIAEHIRKLRIEKARKLLTETDKKISEVAEECGIPDYNYFTKVFKKWIGQTPREYRKARQAKHRKEASEYFKEE